MLDLNNSVAMASAIELLVGAPLAWWAEFYRLFAGAAQAWARLFGIDVWAAGADDALELICIGDLGLMDRLFQFRARNPLP